MFTLTEVIVVDESQFFNNTAAPFLLQCIDTSTYNIPIFLFRFYLVFSANSDSLYTDFAENFRKTR